MSEQCCCGRIKPCDEAIGITGILHEPLGPVDNFCGPRDHHRMRDLEAELTALKAKHSLELLEAKAVGMFEANAMYISHGMIMGQEKTTNRAEALRAQAKGDKS